jgi:hypothetical protein
MYGETKQRRLNRLVGVGAAALAAVALTGCAHNDVLVFGTSTTIGLNVQTASTQGAAPSIVLGYEREEAVWMPLLVNARESVLPLCPVGSPNTCGSGRYPLDQAMYRSTIMDASGQRVVQTDAYSVFASLGAHFNGRATTNTGAEAGGGLAQFFATGNAAVNISANEALVTALKVSSAGASEAQARAVEAASGNETADSAFAGLTEAQLAAARTAAERETNQQLNRVDLVVLCATAGGSYRWDKIVEGLSDSTYPEPAKANLTLINDREALRRRLASNPFLTNDAWAVGQAAPFNCAGD